MAIDPKQMQSVFFKVLAAEPLERPDVLDRACAGNIELRQRVEQLLRAHMDSKELPPAALPTIHALTDAPEGQEHTKSYTSSEPIPGAVIAGRYTLEQPLGEGGMGEVWIAKQSEPVKRKVAIKFIKMGMDSRAVLTRFEQERQALAMMDHPNIARVYDGGLTPAGMPFFVMELVAGLPLNKYCDEAKLSVHERLQLFVSICQAVQHAHQKGIVHRDLKPGNILVTLIDGKATPKIIDFGVAKAVSGKLIDQSLSTQFGAVIGTLEYMSPEQAGLSSQDVDTRADIYSLGVILFEMLTGLRPIDGKRLKQVAFDEMIRIIREEEAPSLASRLSTDEALPSVAAVRQIEPRRLLSLVKGELDWIVQRCLEKDRNRRYDAAIGLARDVQRYLADEPVEARPVSVGYRVRKFVRRNKVPALATGIVLICLIGGILGTTWGLIRAEDNRQIAESNELKTRQKAFDLLVASANLARQRGDWRSASALIEQILEQVPDDLATRLDYARLLSASYRRDEARAELKRLQNYDLGTLRAEWLLLQGEMELGRSSGQAEALRLVREALALGTLKAADKYFAQGLIAPTMLQADAAFDAALKLAPLHHGARESILFTKFWLGRLDDCKHEISVAKLLFPDDPAAYVLTGILEVLRNNKPQLAEAIQQLENRLGPQDVILWKMIFEAISVYVTQLEKGLVSDTLISPETLKFSSLVSQIAVQLQRGLEVEKLGLGYINHPALQNAHLPIAIAFLKTKRFAPFLRGALPDWDRMLTQQFTLEEMVAGCPESTLCYLATSLCFPALKPHRPEQTTEEYVNETTPVFERMGRFFSIGADAPSLINYIPRSCLLNTIRCKAIAVIRLDGKERTAKQREILDSAKKDFYRFFAMGPTEDDCKVLGMWVGRFEDEVISMMLIQRWDAVAKKPGADALLFKAQAYAKYGRSLQAYECVRQALAGKMTPSYRDIPLTGIARTAAGLSQASELSPSQQSEMYDLMLRIMREKWERGDFVYRSDTESIFESPNEFQKLRDRPEMRQLRDDIFKHPKKPPTEIEQRK